jgi:geranylgeranyl reductase family protein
LSNKFETKVCIIGAGPGGAVTAMFLAKKGISCVLIEKECFPRDKICGDALSGKVVSVLKKIDPEIVNALENESSQLGSWGVKFIAPNLKALRVPFKHNFDKKSRPPGFISKRIDFDNFLIEQAKKFPQIQIIQGTQIDKFEKTEQGFRLQSKDGSLEVSAQLVIAADGAHSSFARLFGKIKMEHKHYSAGIRAYYKNVAGMDADNFIELHFLKDFLPGYFWIFPLPNGMANVGVGMRSDKVSKSKINLKEELKRILVDHPALKERFYKAELIGDIKGFGLPLGSKKRLISGDHFMLIGDAASLIDPFTGEGISNAMISGMHAADQAERCLTEGKYSAEFMLQYDHKVYARLGQELNISTRMQQLINYPWLFNLVVNKAVKNKELGETISFMFDDLDLRKRLKDPGFYFRLLFPGKANKHPQ